MVSALHPGASSPGSSPGVVICVNLCCALEQDT